MTVRDSFVRRFGEDEARRIEEAAQEHKNGVHDQAGSDSFRWAICITIGYECFTRFREHHGIAAPADDIKAWCKEEAQLDKHDGDVDYLALAAGAYNEYMPKEEATTQ